MPAYQYEPLSSPDSIRLLLLQPSDARDAELKGSLLNTTLAECDYDLIDSYTALSYVWGSGEKPCQILLDDKAFAITRSLNDALRDMRDATRVRRIWADAICINQEDIPERNSQVRIMRKVYSTAKSTIIYLGGLTKELDAVFQAGPPDTKYGWHQLELRHGVARQVVELAHAEVLARPWFTRVWVFQELVFSKNPWVQCATKRVRWLDLSNLFSCLGLKSGHLGSVMGRMNAYRMREGVPWDLGGILESRRGFGAQDPRDLVYANIHVCCDPDIETHLRADYNDSLLDVFTKTALYINVDFSPTKIIRVDDVSAEDRLPGLPSWAPDWRHRPLSTTDLWVFFVTSEESRIIRNLAYCTYDGVFHSFTGADSIPVLGHIGFRVDTIESIGCIMHLKYSQQSSFPSAREFQKIHERLTGIPHEQETPWVIEHKTFCDIFNTSWSKWLETLSEPLQHERAVSRDFISRFSRWVSKQSTKKPRGENDHSNECSSIFQCLQLYCDYGTGAYARCHEGRQFEHRRLAFTKDGRCGLVPSQARKGDIIGFLVEGSLPAILRPKQTDRNPEIGEAIVQALRHEELGRITLESGPLEASRCLWEFPSEGSVDVEHYSIIGECFFEDWVTLREGDLPKVDNLKVFALH